MIQILCKRLSTHRDKAKRGSERKLHKHQCQPLHYDNASLRASADHARTLDRLANKWLRWANDVSQEMEVSAEVRKLEVELLYGPEVYSIFGILPDSANKRKKDRTVNEGTMQIKFACGNSRKGSRPTIKVEDHRSGSTSPGDPRAGEEITRTGPRPLDPPAWRPGNGYEEA